MKYDEENYEKNTHMFVVKIWLEEIIGKYRLPHWRGYITHIPSGERRYFDHLRGITSAIRQYLDPSDPDTHNLMKRLYQWIWSLLR